MRLELQPFKLVTDVAVPPSSTLDITPANRQKVELFPIPFSLDCGNAEGICKTVEDSEKPQYLEFKQIRICETGGRSSEIRHDFCPW
ncbi:hypothetical protein OIU77_013527 [Salix suchowensis]|uniref:Uncharacterized protein n=1 Tax=Salix suchowensis TaxID=1278906 RepID=A0ABQ8ZUD2_9ROSI|nr:hypothetical protein OIU77_013527 [Salix suchowensis]